MLGYILNLLAGVRGRQAIVWLALAARIVLFVVVLGALARSYGPGVGLVVLVAAVVTRGLLVRKRLAATR